MASKKYLELQEFSDEDLLAEANETQLQYQQMKFDHVIKGLANPLELREVRRDVARLKGEVRRRELAKATPEQLENRSRIRGRRRKK